MKVSAIPAAIAFLGLLSSRAAAGDLVVHEWGVQILGRVGSQQLLSAPAEMLPSLPAFVGRSAQLSPTRFEYHGWDKPVIHLYGDEGLEVSVKVSTPLGVPLAHYPIAGIERLKLPAMSRRRMIAGVLHFAGGLEWRGKLRAAAPAALPPVAGEHWWSAARAIPSSYFQSEGGSERFLFYEATAVQKPVVTSTISAEAIELANRDDAPVGPVVVLVNDGTTRRGAEIASVDPEEGASVPEAELREWDRDQTLGACRRQWRALGMSKEEAEGIVEVWKQDLLERPGVMVIAPMPREYYDQMFPIEIKPEPAELVRAGLVFDTLPGQAARGAWLPGLEAKLRRTGEALASEVFAKRLAAQSEFLAAGDLALGVLAELEKSKDAEASAAAGRIAARIRSAREMPLTSLRPDKESSTSFVETVYPKVPGHR